MKFNKNQCIVNFKNGVKLIHPDQAKQTEHLSVSAFLDLPFSTYFLNTNNETEIINNEGAQVCGFKSATQAQGKTIFDASMNESANVLLANCSDVLSSQQTKIFEETHLRPDKISLQFLSVKIPWYNTQNQIIGIMGCSIALGKHSLASAINQLTSFGLLSKDKLLKKDNQSKQQVSLNDIPLSPRESDCLALTIKGLTAKMIAKKLEISHRTVEEYIYNLRIKVGANSKSELIQLTIDNFKPL